MICVIITSGAYQEGHEFDCRPLITKDLSTVLSTFILKLMTLYKSVSSN
jgi:hypothetical protein